MFSMVELAAIAEALAIMAASASAAVWKFFILKFECSKSVLGFSACWYEEGYGGLWTNNASLLEYL